MKHTLNHYRWGRPQRASKEKSSELCRHATANATSRKVALQLLLAATLAFIVVAQGSGSESEGSPQTSRERISQETVYASSETTDGCGVDWQPTTPLPTEILAVNSVTYGNGRFVAAAGYPGGFLISPDGINWTWQQLFSTQVYQDVEWGGDLFVAVKNQDYISPPIRTSPDGITWTGHDPGITGGFGLWDVTWGDSRYVAVGGVDAVSLIGVSQDGAEWTLLDYGYGELRGVAWNESTFVAVGKSPYLQGVQVPSPILSSADGLNWAPVESNFYRDLFDIAWGADKFVAVGNANVAAGLDAIILVSPDGVTWTEQMSGTEEDLRAVTWAQDQFIAVGLYGTLLTSPDGIQWTLQDSGTTGSFTDITYGADRFVAVGVDVMVSECNTGSLAIGLADALDNTDLSWETSGDSEWYGQSEIGLFGGDAAVSGAIGNDELSRLETSVTGPGVLSFHWRVSSEPNFDFLRFAINGEELFGISGEIDWESRAVELGSGVHRLSWSYGKDVSLSAGMDSGWVDQVVYTSGTACQLDAYESDDVSTDASPIQSGEVQSRSICPEGDEDWAAFSLDGPSGISIETSGQVGDTRLWLIDAGGEVLSFDDDGGADFFSAIERKCGESEMQAGTYYVRVDEYGDDDAIANYSLSLGVTPCAVAGPDIRVEPLSLTFEEEPTNPPVAAIRAETLPDAGGASSEDEVLRALVTKAERETRVRVLVSLDLGPDRRFTPEGTLGAQGVLAQRRAIQDAQRSVLREMSGHNAQVYARFRFIPAMAMEVDAQALRLLTSLPGVRSIREDRAMPSTMASSSVVVGADAAWEMGLDGTGQTVAILDSGVDKSHPFFTAVANKVVSEACYSTTDLLSGSTSLCPGGVSESTASGSGVNCEATTFGCEHGTHVAGTVAGNDGVGPDFGVARGASLISVQIFSRFEGGACLACGLPSPCALSFISDQIKGLERVFQVREEFHIAAVNMSLGCGRYFDQEECDAEYPDTKAAIDNLRSVGTATVVASGNEGFTDSMGAPGCISSAISVGATDDFDICASFSNIAPFLDLLAPGVAITSSVPGGGLASKQGTSMAAPHIAGAFAVLKQAAPGASVDAVLTALRSTGTRIDDTRLGGTVIDMPRINVDIAALGMNSEQTFTVFNDGDETLSVNGITTDQTAPWIAVEPRSFDVPAGESRLVQVSVDYDQAPAGSSTVRILVSSNDADESPYPNGVDVTVIPNVIDTDGDGVPDYLDADDDNDGYADVDDAFPLDPSEWLDTDADGIGNNADTDDDGDTVPDTTDNCPLVVNPRQDDTDGDGIGDACEQAKAYTVSPCRVVDTRRADPVTSNFSGDKLAAGETVHFFVVGSAIDGQGGAADCGIPPEAAGVFANVVVVAPEGAASSGWLTLYPYGEGRPGASTINFQSDTAAIANGVLVPLCDPAATTCDYDLSVNNAPRLDVDLIIDVTGYVAVPVTAP